MIAPVGEYCRCAFVGLFPSIVGSLAYIVRVDCLQPAYHPTRCASRQPSADDGAPLTSRSVRVWTSSQVSSELDALVLDNKRRSVYGR